MGSKKFFLDYLTIADFIAYNTFRIFKLFFPAEFTKQEDWMQPYLGRFEEIPKIKEYMKSDRYIGYAPMGEPMKFGYWAGAGKVICFLLKNISIVILNISNFFIQKKKKNYYKF